MDVDQILDAFEKLCFSPGDSRLRCFIEGIRFAEKHHGITPAEQDPEPVKEVMHTLLGTER